MVFLDRHWISYSIVGIGVGHICLSFRSGAKESAFIRSTTDHTISNDTPVLMTNADAFKFPNEVYTQVLV